MYRNSTNRLTAFIVSVGFFLAGASALLAAQKAGQANLSPTVGVSTRHGQSAPLRDYRLQGPVQPQAPRQIRNEMGLQKQATANATDPVAQRSFGTSQPTELLQFEGQSDDDNAAVIGGRVVPPDTNGDVGPDHYVQYINLILTIYDKLGDGETPVLGPVPGNAPWAGFGGPCETQNDGDPVVRYDHLAGRWVLTQFAVPNYPDGPSYQCFAVSQTGDPTGAYWLYEFTIGSLANGWGDYPKMGVWPDAYYIAFNMFTSTSFTGMGCYAFDRASMLAGDPAGVVSFQPFDGGGLPSDLDGATPPPDGSPNYYMTWWNNSPGEFYIYQFHVDWATPANSTFTGPTSVPASDWIYPVCGAPRQACVPQLDSAELLEAIPDRLMMGLKYRNFGTHESLVTNLTVGTMGGEAAIRWFELRNPSGMAAPGGSGPNGGGPFIYQEGTYNPDSNYRWMGSIAQDLQGNMALGYSISSSTMYPGIAITGRLASDPLGTMGAENMFLAGTGSQINSFSRWGDYSSMDLDPTDDCTFWYTQEYYQNTNNFDFKTRIASFKYPGCTAGETGTLEGTVTDGTNPIPGATVKADGSSTTTDPAGHYQFTLPPESYDMEVTKYGYFPGFASGVVVSGGGNTVQDFVLATAPSTLVNGTVRDSATNWPLYARVQVSAPGFPGATLWTDPVTGYYGIMLVEGITYTFSINAVSPGYLPGGGSVPLAVPLSSAPFVVKNWTLTADPLTCNAPGYTPDISGLYEDFSSGMIPGSWTVTNFSGDGGQPWIAFEGADPCGQFAGNQTGGSGPYAIVNSNCDGFVTDDTDMITSSVDFSSFTSPVLRFNSDYIDCCGSTVTADVSDDGGMNWTNVFFKSGQSDAGPKTILVDLSSYAGQPDVRARFHFDGFWAWWWQVDNILLGDAGCLPGTGGLVVGNVYDASNGNGLNGATVENLGGGSTTTFPTPDPNQNDGFYILYSEAGPNDYEASLGNYQPAQASALVVPGSSQRRDFSLLSGNLSASPSPLNSRVNPGATDEQTLTMTNTGGADASFELVEINAPLFESLTHGFASSSDRDAALARLPRNAKGAVESRQASARDLPALPNRPAPGRPLAAGDVIASWPSQIVFGWGVATVGTDVWLSNIGIAGGDNKDYQYLGDGTKTGETIDDAVWIGDWAADGAFDPLTGNFWRVNVGGDNCIYELNPTTKMATGNSICGSPWAGISQRGLAYDQGGNTFFIGGWNEGVIYHIDIDGNVIDSANVGLAISGLAYSAANGHLLVMSNQPAGQDVAVLDTLNNYAEVGSFQVLDNGSPAFGDFEQAGIEFDCLGNLWAINQITQVVYQVDSGESAGCEVDIPWFSVDPAEGTVPGSGGSRPTGGGNTFPVSANWDSAGLLPGLRQAQLAIKTDTPYAVPSIPVSLTVRFLDVPDSNQFQAFIYGAAGAGIMMGGPPNCPSGVLYFCPNGVVTRADMAGYIFRAVNGSQTPPPVYQNIFGDVTFNDYNSFYIQGIFNLGITAGCGNGNYCPNDINTRAQMAVFIWKGQHGQDPPPACTGVFLDVACPGGFAVDFIEGIYNEGVTVGCGNGNYCPNANISNGQMAVFLVKAFNVPYL